MKKDRQGFTLIELMIVVAILGILAAIAIPTFILFINRSKTAEASSNLKNMFTAVAAYYQGEVTGKSMGVSTSGYCTIPSAGPSPATPSDVKQMFTTGGFAPIGFHIADPVYFSYLLISTNGQCGNQPNDNNIYTIAANGNLDNDTTYSTFELAVGSDKNNVLYHSRGLAVIDEME